jgi:hypothetical protein
MADLHEKCGGLAGNKMAELQGKYGGLARKNGRLTEKTLTLAGKLWLSSLGKYSRLLGKIWQIGKKNSAERQDMNGKT